MRRQHRTAHLIVTLGVLLASMTLFTIAWLMVDTPK